MLVSETIEGEIHSDTGFAGSMAIQGTYAYSPQYLQRKITIRSLSLKPFAVSILSHFLALAETQFFGLGAGSVESFRHEVN